MSWYGQSEERWQASFGKETVRALRESLERLVGEPTAQLSLLFRGLEPYPDGWRASVPRPEELPHYPFDPPPWRIPRRQLNSGRAVTKESPGRGTTGLP